MKFLHMKYIKIENRLIMKINLKSFQWYINIYLKYMNIKQHFIPSNFSKLFQAQQNIHVTLFQFNPVGFVLKQGHEES